MSIWWGQRPTIKSCATETFFDNNMSNSLHSVVSDNRKYALCPFSEVQFIPV